jgi:hypothetical protein
VSAYGTSTNRCKVGSWTMFGQEVRLQVDLPHRRRRIG